MNLAELKQKMEEDDKKYDTLFHVVRMDGTLFLTSGNKDCTFLWSLSPIYEKDISCYELVSKIETDKGNDFINLIHDIRPSIDVGKQYDKCDKTLPYRIDKEQ